MSFFLRRKVAELESRLGIIVENYWPRVDRLASRIDELTKIANFKWSDIDSKLSALFGKHRLLQERVEQLERMMNVVDAQSANVVWDTAVDTFNSSDPDGFADHVDSVYRARMKLIEDCRRTELTEQISQD